MTSQKYFAPVLMTTLLLLSPFARAVTDGEILKIMHNADEAEINAGKYAKSHSDRDDVKSFASTMVDQHKDNLKEEMKVCDSTNLKPQKNETAMDIKTNAKQALSDWKKKKGLDFDKSYIDNQVDMHQKLLSALNQTYIPAAQNPELKSYLQATASHVQEHLDHARQIQSTLQ
jgi:putative membrane protein